MGFKATVSVTFNAAEDVIKATAIALTDTAGTCALYAREMREEAEDETGYSLDGLFADFEARHAKKKKEKKAD